MFPFLDKFVAGTPGGMKCPDGYNLVTSIDACKGQVATVLDIPFFKVFDAKVEVGAIGCFKRNENGKFRINYATTIGHTTNAKNGPVCQTGAVYFST